MAVGRSSNLFFYIFGGVALILLVLAGIFALRQAGTQDHVRTMGVVVEHRWSNDGDTAYVIIEFQAEDGRRFEIRSGVASSNPKPIGADVPVAYPPGDPGSAYVDTFWDRWFLVVLLGGLGIVFLAIAIIVTVSFKPPGPRLPRGRSGSGASGAGAAVQMPPPGDQRG